MTHTISIMGRALDSDLRDVREKESVKKASVQLIK